MTRMIAPLALLALVASAGLAAAQDKTGTIRIENPWARAMIGPARIGAVYLVVRNEGRTADRLISVESPVSAAELHAHRTDAKGVMRMRPLSAVEIPAGGTVEFAPGGLHVMLPGIKAPLEEGQHFPLTLRFEKAGAVTVDVSVLSPTAMDGGGHKH